MHWRTIWDLRHTWWLKTTSVFTVIYGVYAGREKFVRAWRYWCFEHHDHVVWEALRKRPKGHYGRGFRIDELAAETNRTEKSIQSSLTRLEKDNAAIRATNGWFGGNH
jgi:hypothetical protein